MGGGGFTMEPENPLLDEYVLSQSPCDNPQICFLPTASSDNPEYILEFYRYFQSQPCRPTHLALSHPPTTDLESFLLEKDIIYVGGGHTGRMLALWKICGLDKILKKAWSQGILLAGVSSGSSCWFEAAITDSIPGKLSPEKCLGFIKGSSCAHYNNPERRPVFHQHIRCGDLRAGIGIDNFAAVHFVNHQVKVVVSSRQGVAAYNVRKENERTIENKMRAIFLGTRKKTGGLINPKKIFRPS